MARVAIAINSLFGSKNPANPGALTVTPINEGSDHEWALAPGRDILHAHNRSGSTRDIVLVSVADPTHGRTGDVSLTLAAGERRSFGPLNAAGWMQTDGKVYVDATGVDLVDFWIERLPA